MLILQCCFAAAVPQLCNKQNALIASLTHFIPGFHDIKQHVSSRSLISKDSDVTCTGTSTWSIRGLLDFNLAFVHYPAALPPKPGAYPPDPPGAAFTLLREGDAWLDEEHNLLVAVERIVPCTEPPLVCSADHCVGIQCQSHSCCSLLFPCKPYDIAKPCNAPHLSNALGIGMYIVSSTGQAAVYVALSLYCTAGACVALQCV
jgi:hypothetical protein